MDLVIWRENLEDSFSLVAKVFLFYTNWSKNATTERLVAVSSQVN